MSQYYELAFNDLEAEISQYSPGAVQVLKQIKDACGAQTAYYAAFVVVCLRAQQGLRSAKPLDTISVNDFRDYTFFEVAKDNQAAISLFDQVLNTYRSDQNIQ